jgi:hypothetical protein
MPLEDGSGAQRVGSNDVAAFRGLGEAGRLTAPSGRVELSGKTCEPAERRGNNTGLCDGTFPDCTSSRTPRTCCTGTGDRSRSATRKFSGIHRDRHRRDESRHRKSLGESDDFHPRCFPARRDATADTGPGPRRRKRGRQIQTDPPFERRASVHLVESSGEGRALCPDSPVLIDANEVLVR